MLKNSFFNFPSKNIILMLRIPQNLLCSAVALVMLSPLKMSRTAYAICSKNSIPLSFSMLTENVIISPDYCMLWALAAAIALHCIFSALKWKPFVSLNKQPISKSIVNRKSLSRVFSRKWTFFILTESHVCRTYSKSPK